MKCHFGLCIDFLTSKIVSNKNTHQYILVFGLKFMILLIFFFFMLKDLVCFLTVLLDIFMLESFSFAFKYLLGFFFQMCHFDKCKIVAQFVRNGLNDLHEKIYVQFSC